MASNFVYFLLLLCCFKSCYTVGSFAVVCPHDDNHTCTSLDEALSILSSDATIYLTHGIHMIQNFHLIHGLRNVRISGDNTTTVECTAGVGLAFFNISGLVIESLDISRCGLSGGEAISKITDMLYQVVDVFFQIPNDTHIALFLGACTDTTMNRITVTNTAGIGLVGINMMGSFNLNEVSFESNCHSECITDEHATFTDLGKQIGGGAFILYHRTNAAFRDSFPQYANMSISHSSFINNTDCSPNTFVELYYDYSEDTRSYLVGGGGGLTLMIPQRNYLIDVKVESSTFQGNTARFGSAAHIGIFNDAMDCHIRFTDCTFARNGLPISVSPGEQGGAGVSILSDLISPYYNQSRPTIHRKNVFVKIEFSDFIENVAYAGAGVRVYSLYSSTIVNSDATMVMCTCCLFKSNTATLGPALFANSLKRSATTPGIQILLSNVTAIENFVALLKNGTFRTVSDSSAIIDVRRVKLTIYGLKVLQNRGTGLLGVRTRFFMYGDITIAGNVGEFGGGMRLIDYTYIILQDNSTVIFRNNTGVVRGGALYVSHWVEPTFIYSDCFLHFKVMNFLRCQSVTLCKLEQTGIRLEFSGNHAPIGSIVYGSTLSTCCWTHAIRNHTFNGSVFEALHRFAPNIVQFDSLPTGVEKITTPPTKLVVSHNPSTTIPGQSVEIGVAALDQLDQHAPAVITSTVLSASQNATSLIGISGHFFLRKNTVTNVPLRILGPENQTVTVGLYSIDLFADTQFTIEVEQCSPGFVYNCSNCICIEKLTQEGINCNTAAQTLEVPNHLWTGPVSEEKDKVNVVHKCILDYCQPGSKTVSPGDYDSQCADGYNRTGMLCGTCMPGYSTAFGTSRCLKCSNTYLALITVFAIAGILLVFTIFLLKITITSTNGYLNGVLFYCNVITLYTKFFVPANKSFILISFLNLNLGVEVCFYDGMDALTRVGLQLLFPTYLFLLMAMITYLARSEYWCSKYFRSDEFSASKMFGTLLILCYTSILETCIEILGVVYIQTLDGDNLIRWVVDPTVPYFHGWHGVLGTIALILVLFYITLFPIALLFPTYVFQYPKLYPLFDALHIPFKDRFRFWLALRLIVRSIPLVLAFFARYPFNVFMLAIFLIVLLGIQLFTQPFKKPTVNAIDSLLLTNVIALTVGALFFDVTVNTASEDKQLDILAKHTTFSSVIIYTAYAIFLGNLLNHIFLRLPKKLQNKLLCYREIDHDQQEEILVELDQPRPRSPTESSQTQPLMNSTQLYRSCEAQ